MDGPASDDDERQAGRVHGGRLSHLCQKRLDETGTCRDHRGGSPDSGGPVAGFCGAGGGNERMALANSGPSAIEFTAIISISRICGFNSHQRAATDSTMET